MSKKITYKVGDILEVESFAGPKIHKRVTKKVDYKSTMGDEEINVVGFEGTFTRRSDLYALKKASVPYNGNENLKDCTSFTYDHQILKIISRKKRTKRKI